MDFRFWMAAVLAVGMTGCADEPAAPATAKPATVSSPVKETELATITLSPEAEKRLEIATVPAERKSIPRMRTIGGEIVPPSGASISITAPTAGTLRAAGDIPAAGSVVAGGQLLFRLVPLQASERDSSLDAQQVAETARAHRDAAAQRTERAERLLKEGAGSRRALEEAQADLAVAEAEVKAANGRVALAGRSGASESGVQIQAPETGIVQAVHVRAGQAVAAGAAMVDLVRLATVWVRVPIYAGESADIDATAPAEILMLGDPPDADGLSARPIPPPPSANAAAASVDLYYELANTAQRLRPGERVAVRLTRRGASSEGLVVPKAALLHDAYGGTWVYVARGSQVYARQRVAVTDISGSLAILSQGPAAGAQIVTDGAAELFGVEFGVGK